MRKLRRSLLQAALLGIVSVFAFVGLSLADAGPIEPVGLSSWNPSSVSVNAGESVSFKNTSGTSHGVTWTGTSLEQLHVGNPQRQRQRGELGRVLHVQPGRQLSVQVHDPSRDGRNSHRERARKPTVTTGTATVSSDTEATLKGTVDPNEQSTTYFFKWGTTTSYTGGTTSSEPAGNGTTAVNASAELTGLLPKTTYHFKLFATNGSGTSEGTDKTFTTSGPPTATTTGTTSLSPTPRSPSRGRSTRSATRRATFSNGEKPPATAIRPAPPRLAAGSAPFRKRQA